MAEWAIIDFNGYYYEGKFIIKEICTFKSQNGDISEFVAVTLPPELNPSDENKSFYMNFYKKTSINWSTGNCYIDELRYNLTVVLMDYPFVLIKTTEKLNQLKEFLEISNIGNSLIAEDFGFREKTSGMRRVCTFHDSRARPYDCAGYNARKILNWYSGILKISCAVVDFNGYYSAGNKFAMKEISIYGIDNKGSIVYHNLFVVKFPRDLFNMQSFIADYNENYYERYGIEWANGSHDSSRVIDIIRNIVDFALSNKRIFVKSAIHRNQLQRSFSLSREFIDSSLCMDKLDYNEKAFHIQGSFCHFHTTLIGDSKICADFGAKKMVEWIVNKKYYEDRNINAKIAADVMMHRELNANYIW